MSEVLRCHRCSKECKNKSGMTLHLQKCLADTKGATNSKSPSKSKKESKSSHTSSSTSDSNSQSHSQSQSSKNSTPKELSLDEKLKMIQSFTKVDKDTIPVGKNWLMDMPTMHWEQWYQMHKQTPNGKVWVDYESKFLGSPVSNTQAGYNIHPGDYMDKLMTSAYNQMFRQGR